MSDTLLNYLKIEENMANFTQKLKKQKKLNHKKLQIKSEINGRDQK